MQDTVASVTAMSTARMRAIHTRCDPQPVLDDPWGDRLVPPSLMLSAIAGNDADRIRDIEPIAGKEFGDALDNAMHTSPAFTNVILRARFAEDAVDAAIARGVRQYVLIGAGFDSYVLRLPPQAHDIVVIEIDHPATQSCKRQRIRECELALSDNVHFVAADLAREELGEVLARSAFNAGQPVIFTWMGVTMYLTRKANMATLQSIAGCSAAGSELVFNYVDQKWFEASEANRSSLYDEMDKSVQSLGEPFISGFHPASLADELAGVGLELLEDVDEFGMMARYDPDAVNGFRPVDRSHVTRVRIVGNSAL